MLRNGPLAWRASLSADQPTLYSACYAVLIHSLLNTLDSADHAEWIVGFNQCQDEDGLYRDPVIFNEGWYADDPLWCGRPHLTCHVLMALAALDAVAPREMFFLAPYRDPDRLRRWLQERDWNERVAFTGNEVMNIGTLLQYARDFHGDVQAGKAVDAMLDWLDTHHVNPSTGLWGSLDISDPVKRSHAVQAAYHWWPLYFYDRRPVPFAEEAINSLLATQNPQGGFGWGIHNPENPFDSSACEDIDSMDPLARLSQCTPHRRDEIHRALEKAVTWVLSNQASDGGFVFTRNRAFSHGHPAMSAGPGQASLFPTWFRLLSLAIAAQALPDHSLARIPWQFLSCPGMQFWAEPPTKIRKD